MYVGNSRGNKPDHVTLCSTSEEKYRDSRFDNVYCGEIGGECAHIVQAYFTIDVSMVLQIQ